jgi:predicted short-subunit dehydrogenase-like oxidoreductase (DUF2520 family)
VDSYQGRAESLTQLNRHSDAAADWEQALAIQQQLVADFGGDRLRQSEMADIYHHLATAHRASGNTAQADAANQQAAAIEDSLRTAGPE